VPDDLDELVGLLDLEQVEVNIFRGTQPDEERQRVFGGQVAAQALVAAGRTVEHGTVHSLHSYFLRPGDPKIPILYEVDRIRDGKSFTTRRVVAIQHGRAIFNMQTSFHSAEPGFEHSFEMPDVPGPDEVPSTRELLEGEEEFDDFGSRGHPIEMRFIDGLPWSTREPRPPVKRLWIRADGRLDDDPLLHAVVATYASDMSLFDTILAPHPISWEDGGFMGASLDHCMWFHRPFRADEWLLFDTDSPVAYGARGLARGFFFDRAGQLCVSMVQEGLTRVIQKPS
jgi:acyl-CoA thioesterase II